MCSHASRNDSGCFSGRVGILQRVLPAYRAPFFNLLGKHCRGGLGLFAGEPLSKEEIPFVKDLSDAEVYSAKNVHVLDPSSKGYFCWQGGVTNWLEAWNPDVLVVEANPRYLSTPQAVRWMHSRDRPVLGWGLGAPAPKGFIASIQEPGRKAFLQSLDGMIAYSRKGGSEYTRYFSNERISVALNAVQHRPSQIKPPWCASGTQTVVLFVGRLQARKRIDLLLNACAALPRELQPALWIVGDGPARASLETLAGQVYPEAQFCGAKHGSDLAELFSSAHLFVLPGTGGLAVQEALTYGLPVIVAQGDGTQEDLIRSENGWLIRPDDLAALVGTLKQALSDPDRLARMGIESYRIAQEEVNLEEMVQVFIAAFEGVLQK